MRELAQSLVEVIADYRNDDGVHIDVEHVVGWVNQFADADRQFILGETTHVFRTTYLSGPKLSGLVDTLVAQHRGEIERRRWIESHLAGNSQAWMLGQLRARGLDSNQTSTDLLFVDDIIFSGGRAFQDIKAWTDANPDGLAPQGDVLVLCLFRHTGSWNALENEKYGLRLHLHPLGYHPRLRQLSLLEDRKSGIDQTIVVLRCTDIPDVLADPAYTDHFQARTAGRPTSSVFSSDAARIRYELAMFAAGVEVRHRCPNLPQQMRPLGATHLHTPGFGALFVTARNCPNNCPLAWWVGEPWHPLFPRRPNVRHAVAAIEFDDLIF